MIVYTFNKKPERGFTLVESLVAISLLLVALAGPLSIAGQGLALANFARQQVTAAFLAQEAVEYVRNTRDSNILMDTGWLDGLSDCEALGGGTLCTVDIPQRTVAVCPGQVCPLLRHHAESGQYGYGTGSGWEETIFTREVSLEEIAPDAEVEVRVTIRWQTGLASKEFTASENLLNWGS